MKLRAVVLPSLVALVSVAPATASAATLSVSKHCYGPGERMAFSGGGFTPNSPVAISVSGRQLGEATANSVGELAFSARAPSIGGKRRTDFYTATDQADRSLTAGVPVHLSSLNVRMTPKNGNPAKAKRIVARGFTTGRVLWAHVRRGKARRNVKVGRLKGACRMLDVRRKLFGADAKAGLYSVYFDTKRRFSTRTRPQVGFEMVVFRTFKPAAQTSTSG